MPVLQETPHLSTCLARLYRYLKGCWIFCVAALAYRSLRRARNWTWISFVISLVARARALGVKLLPLRRRQRKRPQRQYQRDILCDHDGPGLGPGQARWKFCWFLISSLPFRSLRGVTCVWWPGKRLHSVGTAPKKDANDLIALYSCSCDCWYK